MRIRFLHLVPVLALVPTLACTPARQPVAAYDRAASSDAQPMAARLVGRWRATLTPEHERSVLLTRHALATPPDEQAFAAMDPTAEERAHFRNVVRLRDEEPGSPLLTELRQKLEQLDALRVTITRDRIITPSDEGNDVTRYRVEEDFGDQVIIVEDGVGPTENRRWVVSFEDADHLVMRKGRTVMPLTRVGSEPALDPPSTPQVSTTPARRGGPPSTQMGGALGRCMSEYYACLEVMPPEAKEAMGPALEIVELRAEQAASSPEGRASLASACEDAVALMRRAAWCE